MCICIYFRKLLQQSRCRDCGMLSPKGGICITSLPPKAQESLRKKDREGCQSQRWQMTTRKWCFPATEGSCTYDFIVTVTACTRQTREEMGGKIHPSVKNYWQLIVAGQGLSILRTRPWQINNYPVEGHAF